MLIKLKQKPCTALITGVSKHVILANEKRNVLGMACLNTVFGEILFSKTKHRICLGVYFPYLLVFKTFFLVICLEQKIENTL